jgi:hypothetical protein
MEKKVSVSQFLRTSMLAVTMTATAMAGLVPAHSEEANGNVVTELLAQLKAPPPERQPDQSSPIQSQSYYEGGCGTAGCALCERPHVHRGGVVTCHPAADCGRHC